MTTHVAAAATAAAIHSKQGGSSQGGANRKQQHTVMTSTGPNNSHSSSSSRSSSSSSSISSSSSSSAKTKPTTAAAAPTAAGKPFPVDADAAAMFDAASAAADSAGRGAAKRGVRSQGSRGSLRRGQTTNGEERKRSRISNVVEDENDIMAGEEGRGGGSLSLVNSSTAFKEPSPPSASSKGPRKRMRSSNNERKSAGVATLSSSSTSSGTSSSSSSSIRRVTSGKMSGDSKKTSVGVRGKHGTSLLKDANNNNGNSILPDAAATVTANSTWRKRHIAMSASSSKQQQQQQHDGVENIEVRSSGRHRAPSLERGHSSGYVEAQMPGSPTFTRSSERRRRTGSAAQNLGQDGVTTRRKQEEGTKTKRSAKMKLGLPSTSTAASVIVANGGGGGGVGGGRYHRSGSERMVSNTISSAALRSEDSRNDDDPLKRRIDFGSGVVDTETKGGGEKGGQGKEKEEQPLLLSPKMDLTLPLPDRDNSTATTNLPTDFDQASFDAFRNELNGIPSHPYAEVVRKQSERAILTAIECSTCRDFWSSQNLPPDELRRRLQAAGRHRHRHLPTIFARTLNAWDVEIPDAEADSNQAHLVALDRKARQERVHVPMSLPEVSQSECEDTQVVRTGWLSAAAPANATKESIREEGEGKAARSSDDISSGEENGAELGEPSLDVPKFEVEQMEMLVSVKNTASDAGGSAPLPVAAI